MRTVVQIGAVAMLGGFVAALVTTPLGPSWALLAVMLVARVLP